MVLFAAILLVVSILTAVGLFVLKLGRPASGPSHIRVKINAQPVHESMGTYLRHKLKIIGNRMWHFILEAKDLKPATTKTIHDQYERVKKVFRIRIRSSDTDPVWLPEAAELTIKPSETQKSPEDLYLQAIQRNPTDRQAYEALGRLYLQNRNFVDAAETYEYLTRLDPARDTYFSNLGLSRYSLQEFGKAVAAYEKALSINNKVPTRWINLGLCFEALGDYTKAVKALTQALQLDKRNINSMTLLADAYLKIPNQVRAEEILEQILSLDPTNKSAREKLMKIKI